MPDHKKALAAICLFGVGWSVVWPQLATPENWAKLTGSTKRPGDAKPDE